MTDVVKVHPLLLVCANVSRCAMEDRGTLWELMIECKLSAELRPSSLLLLLLLFSEGECDVRLVVSLVGPMSANSGTIGELRTRRRPNVDQSPGAARWSIDFDSLRVVS